MDTTPSQIDEGAKNVGKQLTCSKCAKPGVLKVKRIYRKMKRTPYLYCYHYDSQSRKIRWCYVGRVIVAKSISQ